MAYKFQSGLARLGGEVHMDSALLVSGAVDLAAGALNVADLDVDGATELTSTPDHADELLIDDGGTNKKIKMSQLGSYFTGTLNIDGLDALGSAAVHQTQDHFLFSDNGTEKKITFSNLQDAVFADVSGDATIAAGGALTLANDAVEQAMIADDAVGADQLAANAVVNASIASNAAIDMDKLDGGSLASSLSDLAQGDLMYAGDVDDSNNLKSITFSNLEDAIFGNVSGDATIAAGGALTIAAGAVEGSMVADDLISAQSNLGGTGVAQADEFLFSDAGTLKAITFSNLEDAIFGNVSGDASVAAGGALTIANDAVEQAMIADDAVGADQLAASAVVNASVVDGSLKADKLDIDGSTDIGAGLADADLIIEQVELIVSLPCPELRLTLLM